MKGVCCLMGALLLVAGPDSFAQDEGDNCRDVLQYSARNYSVSDEEIGISTTLHNQYCQGDSVKSGINIGSGAEAVIKAIPLKGFLNIGTSTERLTSFCKAFDSDYKMNEAKYQSISQVVNETTNAWLSCITLAGKGVLFRPQIGSTQFVLEIQRTRSATASVQGITVDNKLLDCSAPNSDNSTTLTKVDQTTTKVLTDDQFWPVTCLRTPVVENNETIYPRAEISVVTTRGSFLLPIPADAKFPYQFSSQIQNLITQTNDRIGKQEARHYSIKWDDDTNASAVTLNAVPISAGDPSTPSQDTADLGKHDICQVVHTDYHIAVNGESECRLSQEADGDWKLFGSRTVNPREGSTTVCRAKCGQIQ